MAIYCTQILFQIFRPPSGRATSLALLEGVCSKIDIRGEFPVLMRDIEELVDDRMTGHGFHGLGPHISGTLSEWWCFCSEILGSFERWPFCSEISGKFSKSPIAIAQNVNLSDVT